MYVRVTKLDSRKIWNLRQKKTDFSNNEGRKKSRIT
jgi:hypothetical protein